MAKAKINWKRVWREYDKWRFSDKIWGTTTEESRRKKIHKLVEAELKKARGKNG